MARPRRLPSPSQRRDMLQTMPSWWEDTPTYVTPNFENNVKRGYRANELIFACMGTKAETAASTRLMVTSLKDGEEIPDHPLAMLLDEPNEDFTGFDMIGMILLHLDLAAASYWEKVRNRKGQTIQLLPLRPDWVKPIVGKYGIVSFDYCVPGQPPISMPKDSIIDFKLHDPLNFYQGHAPVSVAMRAASVSNAMMDYVNLFFKNGGEPRGILKTKQKLQDDDVTDVRQRWIQRYGGWTNWMAPTILDLDLEYQKTGSTFQEMGFGELEMSIEAAICKALRMPPILVGARVGLDRSTFNNTEEAQTYLWVNVLMGMYKRIKYELMTDLVRDEYPDVAVEWDFTEVIPLQENVDAIWKRANDAVGKFITINEAREEVGLESIEGWDTFVLPNTVTLVPEDEPDRQPLAPTPEEEQEAAQQAADLAAQAKQPPAGEGDKKPPKPGKEDDGKKRARGHSGRKPKLKGVPTNNDARLDAERALKRALAKYFTDLKDDVKDAIPEPAHTEPVP